MGYSDPKYFARPLVKIQEAISLSTSTGAGTASNSLAYTPQTIDLPKFLRRTQIGGISVTCVTAPNAAATAVSLVVMNGTATAGSVAITTLTAGQSATALFTSPNAIIAAGVQPTFAVVGTFTASGGTVGAFDISIEQQELYATP